jgi:hypothetical protein
VNPNRIISAIAKKNAQAHQPQAQIRDVGNQRERHKDDEQKQIVFKGEPLLRRLCSGCTTACCRYQTGCAEAGQARAAYVIGEPRLSDWCKHGP